MKKPLVSFLKLYTILLFIILSHTAKAQAPSFSWSRAIYGDSTEACKIRTDSKGSIYVGGSFNSNSLQFGNTTIINNGWNDIFLSRYDTSGNLIWVKRFGGTGQDLLSAVATDKNGDILIAGSFENSISFDGINLISAGDKDAFYAKIDKLGNTTWAKRAGGTSRDLANDIYADNNGNTFICGDFNSNDFVFAGRSFPLYDGVSTNLFYAKLDAAGDTAWVKTPSIATGASNSLTKIRSTFGGNILLYGSAADTNGGRLSFGISSFANPVNQGLVVYGMFTVEINQTGNTIAETALPIDRFQGNAINCRKNIFYSGRAGHTTQFPEGIISKQNTLVSPYSMGSSSILAGPPFNSSNVLEIAEDNYQKIYFTGHYAMNGAFKAFLVSLDTNLTLINDTTINAASQANVSTFCESIAIDTATNIAYVAGTYSSPNSFLLGTNTLSRSTGSSYDAYLMKVILPKYDSLFANAGNDTAICAGQSVSLGANPTADGNAAPFTYTWIPATGLDNAASANPIAKPLYTTLYTLTVADAHGNIAKDTVLINVRSLPAAFITASGATSFCVGNTVTLNAPANLNYLWSNGGTSQSILANIPGNYSVQVTDANGCSSTSAATTVRINPLPVTPVITASGATTFCVGNTVTLNAPANLNYLWSNGGTSQSILANIPGNYSVQVTDANGCSSTSAATTVRINPLPVTPVITASGATTFCVGNNVTLNAPANLNYLWSNGSTSQSILANIPGNYSVQVTDANGCSSTSAATTVRINPLPVTPVITTSGATTFCAGNSVTLNAPVNTSYLWSNGSSAQSIVANTSGNYSVKVTNSYGCSINSSAITVTANPVPAIPVIYANRATTFCAGDSIVLSSSDNANYLWSRSDTAQRITIYNSGTFSVTHRNSFGCSATSQPTTIVVNPVPPVAGITQAGNVLTSAAGTGNQWYSNNTVLQGENYQTLDITTGANYTTVVTNNFGCSTASQNFTAIYLRHFTTGSKVFFHQEYPNPVVSDFNISYTLQVAKKVSISIIDITGRRMLVPVNNVQQPAGTYTVAIKNAASVIGHGVYFVQYQLDYIKLAQPIIIR